MIWKAEVIADCGEWVGNGLRFGTKEAAERYARDLSWHWTAVREWRVVESDDPSYNHWDTGANNDRS